MNIEHDAKTRKFFVTFGMEEAVLNYRLGGNVIDFYHTFVPELGRGKGIAEKLVKAGFEYAREQKLKVIPTCPYISGAFLSRHPQYQSLVG
ncbi:MAG: N-acetyltransferase [Candidatus Omnitrophica bacterium]|nr:N-acetyltransferase [Candidatus Omnitrophota bacterium]